MLGHQKDRNISQISNREFRDNDFFTRYKSDLHIQKISSYAVGQIVDLS